MIPNQETHRRILFELEVFRGLAEYDLQVDPAAVQLLELPQALVQADHESVQSGRPVLDSERTPLVEQEPAQASQQWEDSPEDPVKAQVADQTCPIDR